MYVVVFVQKQQSQVRHNRLISPSGTPHTFACTRPAISWTDVDFVRTCKTYVACKHHY